MKSITESIVSLGLLGFTLGAFLTFKIVESMTIAIMPFTNWFMIVVNILLIVWCIIDLRRKLAKVKPYIDIVDNLKSNDQGYE